MDLGIAKDLTLFGVVMGAVGYIFKTRPTREEIEPRLKLINERLGWTTDTLFKLAQRTPGVEVKPPPEDNNG